MHVTNRILVKTYKLGYVWVVVFTTSTVMSKGGQAHNNLLETSPELYKDLLFEDDVNRIWAPSTITLPNKGMVFLDGSNLEQWKWASVKSIGITDEDRKNEKISCRSNS